ncbi:MAG: hypothetical protein PUP93_32800, partial [Rhizonema sp. NSF051]|nr:hypothetical protein [Rhizonema sp. NSF051]
MKRKKLVVFALTLRSVIVFSPFLLSVGTTNAQTSLSASPQIAPTTASNRDREELAQLRSQQQIREQVESEVDRSLSRTSILLNVWLVILTLLPVALIASFWLLRRAALREIVERAMERLQDIEELQKQLTSVKQEAEDVIKKAKSKTYELENEADLLQKKLQREKENISE